MPFDTVKVHKKKILVVDEDSHTSQILEKYLLNYGYIIFTASNSIDAITLFRKYTPDLIILDIMLPTIGGYEICNAFREEYDVAIIMLSAIDNVSDRIKGLEFGADDYVVKPFSPKELAARVKSILRRAENNWVRIEQNPSSFTVGNLLIDESQHQVFKNGERIYLTELEFSLLQLLVHNAGERLSRTYILDNVWGYTPERFGDTRVVDVHISRLRAKLEETPNNPDFILTIRGLGYSFQNFKEN